MTSGSIPPGNLTHHSSPHHPATLHLPTAFNLEVILTELQERHEEIDRLREELESAKVRLYVIYRYL